MFRLAKGNGFQAKVLTHLDYIKKKQDEHDISLKDIDKRLDSLPCETHKEQIKTLFNSNKEKGEEEQKSTDRKIYMAIGGTAVIISAIHLIFTFLV